MKKLLIVVLAAAAMVACTNDEVVSVKGGDAIAFDNAFIDNATRAAVDPSTTTGSISAFDVWAFMDEPAGIVFEDEDVKKVGEDWTYINTQYWLPDHHYYFAALAPMNSANWDLDTTGASTDGIGEVTFRNIDGSEDLIYAATRVDTPEDINTQPGAVKFQFNHLLSKVKFTFKNGFTNETAQIVVKDIAMTAPAEGSINLAQADWWSTNQWVLATGTTNLEFGDVARLTQGEADECAQERLSIPADADQEYDITFTVDLYMGDVIALEGQVLTSKVTGVALEMGKAYNFTATLSGENIGVGGTALYPITFDVEEVKEWVEAGDKPAVLDGFTVDGNYTLVADGKAVSTIEVTNGGVLDGAGHTLTLDKVAPAEFFVANTLRYINTNGDVTIKNLTIDGNEATYDNGTDVYGIRGIFLNGGKVTLENVHILNCTYGINTGSGDIALTVNNSTLQSWSSWDNTTSAVFNNVKFTGGLYANARPYHSTTFINCNFEAGFKLDLSKVEAGQVLTLIDCYYDGNKVTAANVSALVGANPDMTKLDFNTTIESITGGTTTLTDNVVAEEAVEVNGAVLDGGGNTVTVAETPGSNGIICPAGDSTVKNITIDGNDQYYDPNNTNKSMRGIYITKAGNYTFDNVKVFNCGYALNVNTTATVTLKISNSTLEGWVSYGNSTTADFVNVAFTEGEYFGAGNDANGYFRPYGNTTLKDCTFPADYIVDFGSLTGTIEFENCYVGSDKITAANINSFGWENVVLTKIEFK